MLCVRHKGVHTEMMWCRGGCLVIQNMSSSSDAGVHFHLALTDRLLMKQLPPWQGRMKEEEEEEKKKKKLQSTPTYIASPSSSPPFLHSPPSSASPPHIPFDIYTQRGNYLKYVFTFSGCVSLLWAPSCRSFIVGCTTHSLKAGLPFACRTSSWP